MWNIEETSKFLENETVVQIESEQLHQCRLICHVLNGDYSLEMRNDTFGPGKIVNPVPAVKEGELCLISAKRYPSQAEYEETLTRAKTEAHRANMVKARAQNQKNYFDSGVSRAFSDLLRKEGYLTHTGHAKRAMTVSDLKADLRQVMENYLAANCPNRDELALKLIAKDSAFIHFASSAALTRSDYCIRLLDTNPDFDLQHVPKIVRNDWKFIHALFNHTTSFEVPFGYFNEEISKCLDEAEKLGVLEETIAYEKSKVEFIIAEQVLNYKLQFTDPSSRR